MKKLILPFLLFALHVQAQNQQKDNTSSEIESSKFWQDVDYVGDGITGHKLDIYSAQNR